MIFFWKFYFWKWKEIFDFRIWRIVNFRIVNSCKNRIVCTARWSKIKGYMKKFTLILLYLIISFWQWSESMISETKLNILLNFYPDLNENIWNIELIFFLLKECLYNFYVIKYLICNTKEFLIRNFLVLFPKNKNHWIRIQFIKHIKLSQILEKNCICFRTWE